MPPAPSRAVISVLNTPAGRFRWYEDFPSSITTKLATHGIAHHVAYKHFLPHSRVPAAEQIAVHDETDATKPARIRAILAPLCDRYDRVIIHTHSHHWPAAQFWQLTRGRGDRRWWATVHTTVHSPSRWRRLGRGLMQQMRVSYPDRAFGCSATATAALRRMLPPHRVGMLRNGLLTDLDLARFDARASARRVLFVGRFATGKGVDLAIEGAAHLASRYTDFHLTLVGDGPGLPSAREQIVRLGLSSRVTLAGYQSDVTPWYAAADIVWILTDPSIMREGLALVALEAQSHALPVVYTASGGLPDTQIANQTGILLPNRSAATLAEITASLMDDDHRYHAMRESIRAVRADWTIERMTDDYVAAYLDEFARLR